MRWLGALVSMNASFHACMNSCQDGRTADAPRVARFMMGYLGYTRKDKLVLMCIAAASALATRTS